MLNIVLLENQRAYFVECLDELNYALSNSAENS